jgi:hypothetical protein
MLAALVLRLLWLAYTHHTAEDAFVTFRFARNLAQGYGFTYNLGERVYATTTPLFALLLAGWRLILRGDIVIGSHALGLVASLGSLLLLDAILRQENIALGARLLALAVLALCSKVIVLDMQGMEIPLVIFLLMASWHSYACGRARLAGLLAGWLLWVRIDLALWPAALVIVEGWTNRKRAVEVAGVAALTYLPWAVFASLYFGSPIPHTITAKQVAYGLAHGPVLGHLTTVLAYLSPFDGNWPPQAADLAAGCLTLGLAIWQVSRVGRSKAFATLALFAALEFAGLVLARATFFARYLYPLLWAVLILASLGVVSLWQAGARRWLCRRWIAAMVCLVFAAMLLVQTVQVAGRMRATQRYRYEASLQAIGAWLGERGPAGATVLLEPLGYIGYCSDMRMVDEVGLVSPDVVALKLRGVPVEEYFSVFWPEFIVEHCDEATRFEQTQTGAGVRFADHYTRVATFDPLGFGADVAPQVAAHSELGRSACYIVWQRNLGATP